METWTLVENVTQDDGTIKERSSPISEGNARVLLVVQRGVESLAAAQELLADAWSKRQPIVLPDTLTKFPGRLIPPTHLED